MFLFFFQQNFGKGRAVDLQIHRRDQVLGRPIQGQLRGSVSAFWIYLHVKNVYVVRSEKRNRVCWAKIDILDLFDEAGS